MATRDAIHLRGGPATATHLITNAAGILVVLGVGPVGDQPGVVHGLAHAHQQLKDVRIVVQHRPLLSGKAAANEPALGPAPQGGCKREGGVAALAKSNTPEQNSETWWRSLPTHTHVSLELCQGQQTVRSWRRPATGTRVERFIKVFLLVAEQVPARVDDPRGKAQLVASVVLGSTQHDGAVHPDREGNQQRMSPLLLHQTRASCEAAHLNSC
jgi:hypothetical protein